MPPKIAYGSRRGLENSAEWPLCLAYGCLAVSKVLQAVDPKLVLRDSPQVGVAAGFDEGDFLTLGVLSRAGWQPIDFEAG